MINTVKINGDNFLVNGLMSVPNDPRNSDYQAVQRWLLGKTDEWLALEEIFNQETKVHDNFIDITTYDARLAQYEINIVTYTEWERTEETPDKPEEPIFPVKPKGYYTQDESDASILLHQDWVTDKKAFTPSVEGEEFNVSEPLVLSVPENLNEPTIIPLPALIPNIPEAEFTQAELDAQAIDELNKQARFNKLIGVEFEGIMCSATSEDMWGLTSIKPWVESGNDVNFKFSNGNKLILTSANIAAFELVWSPFRASFF